jgi:hypothetical protein
LASFVHPLISLIGLGEIGHTSGISSMPLSVHQIIGFGSLVGLLIHWLFCKRIAAAVIEATKKLW